jgi:hypothetical protein
MLFFQRKIIFGLTLGSARCIRERGAWGTLGSHTALWAGWEFRKVMAALLKETPRGLHMLAGTG